MTRTWMFKFVEQWHKAKSINEVCKALNITHDKAIQTVKRMRRNGVPLKEMDISMNKRREWEWVNASDWEALRNHYERVREEARKTLSN